MLLELRVENLLLIERAELRLGPGLTAITGETGAGKTVLAHALDLLLGGRPRSGIVRPGASEAYVEGVFAAPPDILEGDALADLRERLSEAPEEIVLGRRVGAEGRTRAFVQGRSASAADLRELGEGPRGGLPCFGPPSGPLEQLSGRYRALAQRADHLEGGFDVTVAEGHGARW